MDTNIGDSYILSIGQTYVALRQTFPMGKKPDRTVWARLKEALKDAKKPSTQTEAARIAGIEQPSVSLWNKPGGYPTIENAVALATATNVCVEWILSERGPKHPGPPEEKAAKQLWEIWPHLSELTKGKLLGIAQSEMQPPDEDVDSQDLQRDSG